MHTTIAVPSDVSVQALARALSTIGLKPAVGRARVLSFDHVAQPDGRPLCREVGCTRPALVTDASASLCAKHWLALKVPA